MASWLRRNWWRVVWNLALVIGLIYGSILGFTSEIQKTLNVQLTLTQTIALGLIVVTSLGLILTIARSVLHSEHPRPLAPFYRLDNFNGRVEKTVYEWGQEVFFIASFSGQLRAGYFDTVLISPKDETYYIWDRQTLLGTTHLQEGELHGEMKNRQARWSTPILVGWPEGEWTAHIGIYDCIPLDLWTLARVRFLLNWAVRKIVKRDWKLLAHPQRVCIDQRTARFRIVKHLSPLEQMAQRLS